MDFYSGKKPNLIGPIMKSTVIKIVKKPNVNNTVSDKVTTYVSNIYDQYIAENKMIVLILILLTIFLVYRYYDTKNKKENQEKETFSNQDYNLIKDIKDYQTRHLRYDTQPVMNPTKSESVQRENVNYPPDPLPVNIPNTGFVYTRNLYENPPAYEPINFTNYNHDNVYENPSRSYYNGTYNTYQDAQDTNIVNPYGWSNNFNTNTGNFVGGMTEANRQNLYNYQAVTDNENKNLVDALKYGPKYVNPSSLENDMEPPYARD